MLKQYLSLYSDRTDCLNVLLVTCLLREDYDVMFCDDGSNNNPRIRIRQENDRQENVAEAIVADNSTFEVYVEDRLIASTDDLVKAFATMIGCHYIFNLSYCKELEGTFIFMQKYVLKICDSTKTPGKVLGLINKVKKLL